MIICLPAESADAGTDVPSMSPWARIRRWSRLLLQSRSPSLSVAAARQHASDPVLRFLAHGGSLRPSGATVNVHYGSFSCSMPVSGLPAVEFLARMIDGGYEIVTNEREWQIVVPGGPHFFVEPASLASDIPVIAHRFLEDEYRFLSVKERTVLDIGANIGDSSVYFVFHGAKRVVAYEPFPATFQRALRNVLANEMTDRVVLVNAGVGSWARRLKANYSANVSSGLTTVEVSEKQQEKRDGETLQIVPFSEAVEAAGTDSSAIVCKVDCEGCEFEILDDPELEYALDHIEELLIEFHWKSPDPWVALLSRCGFTTRLTDQQPGVGLIHAVRHAHE